MITFQLIVSLLFTTGLFYFIGVIAKSEIEKVAAERDVYIVDLDGSQESKVLIENLSYAGFKTNLLEEKDKSAALEYASGNNLDLLIVIPEGFSEAASQFEFKNIEAYTYIRSFSISSSASTALVEGVISEINRYISNSFLKEKFPDIDPDNLKNPIKSTDFVIVRGQNGSRLGCRSKQHSLFPVNICSDNFNDDYPLFLTDGTISHSSGETG